MKEKTAVFGKKISVIGAGVSGAELARLASRLGAAVFVSDAGAIGDERKKLFEGLTIKWESGVNSDRALEADLMVVSSGIPPQAPILQRAADKGVPVVGELDFVYPYLNGRMIAVTGSNGKTTTASMTGFFLERLGRSCLTGGNIGNAAARAAGERYEYIVLELSSFQLHWAGSFRADAAVVTNLAPDHLDWHGSYEKYTEAKAKAISLLKPGGTAIYQLADETALHAAGGVALTWDDVSLKNCIHMDEKSGSAWLRLELSPPAKLFDFADVKLLGRHNLENAAMSVAVLRCCGIIVTPQLISEYTPQPHRCAFVGEARGVTFVDDSKGTNVAASVTAMSSLPNRKVVILGGKGKGEDYEPLATSVAKYAAWAVLLGEEREKIAAALESAGFGSFSFAADMDEAVRAAYGHASAGETVLLSPACTSWDMYPNYGARGDHFCRAALELVKEEL